MLPLFINGARGGELLVYQEGVLGVLLLVYQVTTCCPWSLIGVVYQENVSLV